MFIEDSRDKNERVISKSYQNKIVNINGNLFIYTIVHFIRSNRSENGAIMASLVIFITIQVNILTFIKYESVRVAIYWYTN